MNRPGGVSPSAGHTNTSMRCRRPLRTVTGTEALQIGEGLFAVSRTPAPLRVEGPERKVREHHDGSARRFRLEVFFEPCELLSPQLSHAFQGGGIHQAHEMDALLVEAVPARSPGFLAEAGQILFAVVGGVIVFAGNIENFTRLRAPQ